MRAWVHRLLLAAAFLASLVVALEGSIRILAAALPSMRDFHAERILAPQLWRRRHGPGLDRELPFMQPIPIFTNRDSRNPDLLKFIYYRSRYSRFAKPTKVPAGGSWRVPDFLQSPARDSQTLYRVTMNSLGFRNPEHPAAHGPRLYRIVCLGSYQTFGHGVDDEDPYPRQLEKALNSGGGPLRFEVWNGGMQSATAIVGLARLRHEIFRYKPDLLIFNYSYVDGVAVDDTMRPPELRTASIMRARPLFVLMDYFHGRSYLLNWICSRLERAVAPTTIAYWKDVTRQMLEEARRREIPVILLDDYPSTIPRSAYEAMLAEFPGARYVSVREAYAARPPDAAQIKAFRKRYHWPVDYEPAIRVSDVDYFSYRVDWIHPNYWGHRAIALSLARTVKELAAKKAP